MVFLPAKVKGARVKTRDDVYAVWSLRLLCEVL